MRKLLLSLVLILSACNDNSDAPKQMIFSVNTDNVTVTKLLPVIRKSFPGLDKYSDQFQKISVEQNNQYTTIKFHIPDNAVIPVEYRATGHNCFIEINKEGSAVKIPKTPCKAVMLDHNADTIDSEQWFSLPLIESTK